MTEDRWKRVQGIFEKALERPPAARTIFLDEACGDDAELRAEVDSLLAHDLQADEAFMATRGLRGHSQASDVEGPAETVEVRGDDLVSATSPQIAGYEIIRELHRGGQGVVYQAVQKSTKRKVAIKVLLEGPYASEKAKRRFEREIELVASLKHPNIISVFHSGQTHDGRHFCVMDYVRGRTLLEHVRDKKLNLEEALKLFATVCNAVNYAHQKGIIHRDLKPSNILVDSDGNSKVLDFGLAKMVGGPEQTLVSLTGQVVGTLPYMSPEQARGNPDEIDIRTDVYALGVILYEILTGRYPYPVVGQMADVLKHIAETPPTPPTRRWRSDSGVAKRSTKRLRRGVCPIDDEVQTIILKTLSKERERRYQAAGELARDIGHYLAGEPIEAKRDSGLYVLKKMVAHRLWHIVVATGVLVLTIAGYALWEREHEATELAHAALVTSLIEADWEANQEEVQALYADFLERLENNHTTKHERRLFLSNAVRLSIETRNLWSLDSPVTIAASTEPRIALGKYGVEVRGITSYWLGGRMLKHGDSWAYAFKECGVRGWSLTFDPTEYLRDLDVPGQHELVMETELTFTRAGGGKSNSTPVSGDLETVHRRLMVTIFVLPSYPAGYPVAITDPNVTEKVEHGFLIQDFLILGNGDPKVLYKNQGPVNIAGWLEILDPSDGKVLGKKALVALTGGGNSGLSWNPAPWVRALLPLVRSGELDSLSVRLVPDREVALSSPTLETYWGLPIESTVQFRKASAYENMSVEDIRADPKAAEARRRESEKTRRGK